MARWLGIIILGTALTFHQAAELPTSSKLQDEYGDALESIFGIGIRLHALLEDPSVTGTNFLVSPLSIASVVGQLMLGAEGKFRKELYNLLSLRPEDVDAKENTIGYYNDRTKSKVNYYLAYPKLHMQLGNLQRVLPFVDNNRLFNLTISNALFHNSNIKLQYNFTHNLELYKTYIKSLNFNGDGVGSQKFINDWAAQETNNLIKTILTSPLSSADSAIFTNAIYFKADWATPFSYEMNVREPFRVNQNKSVEVDFMRGFFEGIQYGESAKLGCKMIALPYKEDQLRMYVLLPNENNGEELNIKRYASNLNAEDLLEFMNATKKRDVNVQIPKLKLSSTLSVLKPLKKYQIFKEHEEKKQMNGSVLNVLEEKIDEFTAFNTTEDVDVLLSKAAINENLKVSDIIQQINLSVDEKGTEAAAVTASLINYSGGVKSFKANRPFMFFIRHQYTSITLFWGLILDPLA